MHSLEGTERLNDMSRGSPARQITAQAGATVQTEQQARNDLRALWDTAALDRWLAARAADPLPAKRPGGWGHTDGAVCPGLMF